MATERKSLEAVAKHIRFNLRTKAAVLRREKVEYFTGKAAVDCLMKSKWARKAEEPTGAGGTSAPRGAEDSNTPEFYTRANAETYCDRLLELGFMLRVNKVEVKPSRGKSAPGADEDTQDRTDDEQGQTVTTPSNGSEDGGKRRRKRYRLEVHPKQQFRDGDDLYIWKYNPPSMSTYVIGFIVVLGAIAWTLQPLWPSSTRVAMWYIAIAAACLVGVLLVLLVLRWFLYGLIFVFTMGKVHFWVFPNLNEEKYGFVDSFKPFYSIENTGDRD